MNGADARGKYVCLKCGKGFTRRFNMERHLSVHDRDEEVDEGEEEEEQSEDDDHRDENSDEVEEDSDGEEEAGGLENNDVFREWLEDAKDATREAMETKYQKYVDRGMEEGEAAEKARFKTTPDLKRAFFDRYREFLRHHQTLRHDEIHSEILEDLENRVEDGMDVRHAVKRALAKHDHEFAGLLQYEEEEEEESDVDEG